MVPPGFSTRIFLYPFLGDDIISDYPFRKNIWYNGVKIDIKARTEEELGIKYARKINAIEKEQATTGGSTPLNKWVSYYFDTYVAENVTDGVLKDRKGIYNKHIKPFIGSMRIKDINAGHCQRIINEMSGYSRHINKTCQLMFNIFGKAKSEKLIYENPADDIIRPLAARRTRPRCIASRACADASHGERASGRTVAPCHFKLRIRDPERPYGFLGSHINYRCRTHLYQRYEICGSGKKNRSCAAVNSR